MVPTSAFPPGIPLTEKMTGWPEARYLELSCTVCVTRSVLVGAAMAAMVLRSTAMDAPPQPEMNKAAKRIEVRRSPVFRGRHCGHATFIFAPVWGESKEAKACQ